MVCGSGSAVVIALLVLSGAVAQDRDTAGKIQKLIALFEEALVNDSYNLWILQQIFFNPNSNQSPRQVCLSVFATVGTIANPESDYRDCFDDGAFIKYEGVEWHFDSYYELQQVADASDVTSELATLMSKSGSTSVFYTMDPTFYYIMQSLSSSIAISIPHTNNNPGFYYNAMDDERIDCANIPITIAELDEMPCLDDTVYAMRSVLMWAKFYARTNLNGTKQSREEADRISVSVGRILPNQGYYYEGYCKCDLNSAGNVLIQPLNTWALVLGIFYFSNLLVLTSALLHFRKVFLWLQGQNKKIKTLYKASATVLACVNIIALISDLYIIISDGAHKNQYGHFSYMSFVILWILLPGKVPLVLLILILETPVACFNTHLVNQRSTRCQRFAHAFGLCQITWFVHRLINDVIISVIFFVLAPAQTLGVITLLLATIASAIAFVSILIHNFKGCNRKMCTHMICVTLNGLIICGLLLAITLLYIVLVDNGLKSAGMGGLILSLVPPLAVFTIGLIINQKYFKSQTEEPPTTVTTTPEPGEPNQATAIETDDNEVNLEGTPLLQQVRARS